MTDTAQSGAPRAAVSFRWTRPHAALAARCLAAMFDATRPRPDGVQWGTPPAGSQTTPHSTAAPSAGCEETPESSNHADQ
jgi:hypothetical protein